jgi:hypothetical protein
MLPIDIDSVKGFLDKTEGEALYHLAFKVSCFALVWKLAVIAVNQRFI